MTKAPSDVAEIVDRLSGLLAKATPGPWAWEQCGDKEDAPVIGIACLNDDADCKLIAGQLRDFDNEGREIDYYRETIARDIYSCGSHSASSNAALIVEAVNALPALLAALQSRLPDGYVADREAAILDDIAAMMSEFVENWPQPKRIDTAIALIAKTLRHALHPPKHVFWGAGEKDCPREIKASNGELHTLRCKVCGRDNPRDDRCFEGRPLLSAAPSSSGASEPARPIETAPQEGHFLGWNSKDEIWEVWAARTYWANFDARFDPPPVVRLDAEATTHWLPYPAPPTQPGSDATQAGEGR